MRHRQGEHIPAIIYEAVSPVSGLKLSGSLDPSHVSSDPVAVGSVCIASFKTKPPLTDAQKSILVRFGKAIMHAM